MFIKRLHLFCSYQIGGVGGNNASLANTGMTLLEQRNLLVPLQTLKRFVVHRVMHNSLTGCIYILELEPDRIFASSASEVIGPDAKILSSSTSATSE